ncbi:thrombospondin type 3 repeat-containing protein [Desulfoluna sp.]|uniref:thrombospondin type 3 repeat-containing protein n=1 Tax=Desulfoluna sp. TaxID=2045199 RepID=UPI002607E16D|nr:thrombospondin type 3 repeat-containing protein [Desulfoluna sp.]
MKSKCILLLALLLGLATQTAAMTITAGPATLGPNGRRLLPITLSDLGETLVESVAGTAFTLAFDTTALNLESVTSEFFAPFKEQFTTAKTQPLPEIPPLQKTPVIWNEIDGTGVAIAGARCIATSETKTLFHLTFALKPGADPKAIYPIRIRPTTLSDTGAGYAAGGETIPVLLAADATQAAESPAAYPVIIDSKASGALIENGHLSFDPETSDRDGDGMDDAWEIAHFGNTTTAGIDTDSDGDGICDRDEYQNGSNPGDILPVLLAVANPCIANTADTVLTLQGERLTLFSIKQVLIKQGNKKTPLHTQKITADTVEALIPKGLAEGKYTLELLFANGETGGSFTVKNPELSVALYQPLALNESQLPTAEALNAIDMGSTLSDGGLTDAQLNGLGLGNLAHHPGVKVTLEEKNGQSRSLHLHSETGIEIADGKLPLATRLLSPKATASDPITVDIQFRAGTHITIEGAPYTGAINPPRSVICPPKKKGALSTLLGTSELWLFSAGNAMETLNLSKPALVFLEIAAPANAAPTIFYLEGSTRKKVLAGIDGTAEVNGTQMDIARGGTVVTSATRNGKTIQTLAVLLDHFSTYAVGWSEEPETSGGSGGSGGCFINTLKP